MYTVLQNGKPADSSNFKLRRNYGWNTSTFDSFDKALLYANLWLGHYGPMTRDGSKFDYNEYGDTVEIVLK